jgi:hypothetical protein
VTRTAACACGQLSVTAEGEPSGVYACSCTKCQRSSGSAFSYAAVFARSAVAISGEHKSYRGGSDSGRWNEGHFCPGCGTSVFSYVEAAPDDIIVAAGCFADPSLKAPQILFWASQRHHWLAFPDSTTLLDSQPE